MILTDRDRELIKEMIDRGEPLPPKYKLALFADAPEVELMWQGKSSEVTNIVLPFQSIEQVDEPRSERSGQIADLFSWDKKSGRQIGGWTNKLIWGDNRLVLSSLKNGPIRKEIEAAGGLKLIYIDPPFDVGADFTFDLEVGDDAAFTKEPTIIEELAYRDTWGKGADSYIGMMHERLRLISDLLHPSGSLYVHCDHRVNAYLRLILDEIFGQKYFKSNIIWKSSSGHSDDKFYSPMQNTILYFSKSDTPIWNQLYGPYDDEYLEQHYQKREPDGRRFEDADLTAYGLQGGGYTYEWKGVTKLWRCPIETMQKLEKENKLYYTRNNTPRLKRYLDEMDGAPITDIWLDIPRINSQALEKTGYITQKPEALLERVIRASSNEGDLVADLFCGSGTTLAVAEKLNRKWVGCDLGRFAIHTSRKRMISVQRQMKTEGKPYRSFEILNLGKYERQYFAGINPNLPEEERKRQAVDKEEQYLSTILQAYKGERVQQMPPFHGRKGSVAVFVGPIDSPVTISQVEDVIAACEKQKVSKVDVLGFEFEMGLVETYKDKAKLKGIALAIRWIPKDVFDKRAVEKGQVKFFDAAYMEITPKVKGKTVIVKLESFGVFYTQDHGDSVAEALNPGASRIAVENGQVVRFSKNKTGVIKTDILTKQWTDWIDYWAVDFNFENRKEIIRTFDDAGKEVESWTGAYIFENEWQTFRTKQDRKLELESSPFEYAEKGKYKIAVKVIDIFGNDTTKIVDVRI